MSEHCCPLGIDFSFLCFQEFCTLEFTLLFPTSGLTSGSSFQLSMEVAEEMTPSCLTSLQNTTEGLEQDSKHLDIGTGA